MSLGDEQRTGPGDVHHHVSGIVAFESCDPDRVVLDHDTVESGAPTGGGLAVVAW